ncbi:MAG: SurA N-terminal domain-containing protein [Nitrospinota bacterium]
MVQINFARKEVSCKLVFYGPGQSGKTTNLEVIHQKAPDDHKGDLTAIATEGDRTLFFDFLPLDLGKVKGMNTKFQLYTVPGQVYYASTRKLVLQGADGVIFVADSQRKKLDENIESLNDLVGNLKENGIDIKTFPMVIQWNKRDLPDAAEVSWLEEKINKYNAPTTVSVAASGEGVMNTLKVAAKLVLAKFNEQGSSASSTAMQATSAPKKKEVVVATVNGAKISRKFFLNYSQVQYRLNASGEVEDFKKLSKKEAVNSIQNLINHSLLMQEAKNKKITVDKKQLEAQVNQFVKRFGSKDKFEEFLKSRLLNMDNVKNEAIRNIVMTAMVKNKYPNLAQQLEIPKEVVEEYFQSHSAAFPGGLEKYSAKITAILKNKKKKKLTESIFAELRSKSKVEIFEDKL